MGRKRLEWTLLALVLALVGAFLAFIHFAEFDRVYATEHDRLRTLSKVLAGQITHDLDATNRSLTEVIADSLAAQKSNGTAFDISRRLHALHGSASGSVPVLPPHALSDHTAKMDPMPNSMQSTATESGLTAGEPVFKSTRRNGQS